MFAKILTIVLFFLSVQNAIKAKEISYPIQEKQARDVIDVVVSAIQKVVESAIAFTETLVEEVVKAAKALVKELTESLGDLIDSAKHTIEEAIDEAEGFGIDVKECIADEEEEFQELVGNLAKQMDDLITYRVDEVNGLLKKIEKTFLAAKEELDVIKQQLDDCGVLDWKCWVEVAESAEELGKKVKDQIIVIKDEVVDMIEKDKVELPEELKEIATETFGRVEKIKNDIIDCIKGKLPS